MFFCTIFWDDITISWDENLIGRKNSGRSDFEN